MRSAYVMLSALTLTSPAFSQSFDCKVAKSPREHAICSDPQLAQLDSTMAKEFSRVHKGVPRPFAATILDDQRVWLNRLDAVCPAKPTDERAAYVQDISCFIYAYKARIGELQENKPLDNWHWLITTRGQSSRPEILTPTTAEQAWNKAVAVQVKQRDHNAAEELASCKQGADPDRAENMEVDADSKIVAANSHLIAMTFTVFEDCGGAHPDTSFENWEWSLDLNRTVTPDDVFRAGSNWQPFVTAEITRQLLASDIGQYLWQGKQLADALNDAVSSTKQWTLTRDGIDIQFEQYQVTAYAFGMPQIFIPWKDMGPYLKPDWKPELLPARIPVPSP